MSRAELSTVPERAGTHDVDAVNLEIVAIEVRHLAERCRQLAELLPSNRRALRLREPLKRVRLSLEMAAIDVLDEIAEERGQ